MKGFAVTRMSLSSIMLSIIAPLIVAGGTFARIPEQHRVLLTLEDCVAMALKKNIELQSYRLDYQDAISNEMDSRAIYDPQLSVFTRGNYDQSPGTDRIPIADSSGNVIFVPQRTVRISDRFSLNAELARKLPWGTDVDVSLSGSRSHENTNWYTSGLRLRVDQPLLRGFGRPITERTINIARLDRNTSIEELRQGTINTVVDVEEAYWNLALSRESAKVGQLQLESARRLLSETKVRVAAGAAARTEILTTEVSVANARVDSIKDVAAVRSAEDALKILINLVDDKTLWNATVILLDRPTLGTETHDETALVAQALANRPDYRQMLIRQDRQKLWLLSASDRLKPSLTATGSLNLTDSDDNFSGATDEIVKAEFQRWSATLTFNIPIGNTSARANMAQAEIGQRRAELERQKLEQQITREVRSAVRESISSRERIVASEEAVRLQESNVSAEQERLRMGLTTNYRLLEAEKNLSDARGVHLEAVIDYQKALTALARATGSILEARGITVQDSQE